MSDTAGVDRVDLSVWYSVMVVDDEAAVHALARRLLEPEPRVRVVGGSLTLGAGLQLAAEVDPDLIILDESLPDGTGSASLAGFRDAARRAKVVLFSAVLPDPLPHGVERGVSKVEPGRLLEVVREVMGLAPPVELDENCPACEGTLLVTAVSLPAEEREVVCRSCRRVFRSVAHALIERGVLG